MTTANGTATVVFSHSLGYLSVGQVAQTVRYGLLRQRQLRRNLEIIDATGDRIRAAERSEEILAAVVDMAQEVGADGVLCKIAVTGPWDELWHASRRPRFSVSE